MKAIVYIRFSSDEQAEGNSIERQTTNALAYCARNGLALVETIIDDGYSAFKGDHLSKGNLGRFLLQADKGKYRGRALVVEQMDRLSRLGIEATSDLLKRILKAGIEVHVTQENRVIKSLDDLMTVILNAVQNFGAVEYSKKLRERIGAAWSAKKRNCQNGTSITGQLPGWLDGKTGQSIEMDEAKAKVVRQIFEWTARGMGKRLVTRRLNEQGVPTFAGAKQWVHGYVHRILTNRAVLGEYQPFKGKGRERKPDGDARINFYPSVVTPNLWQRAHDAMAARRTITKSGAITGKFAGRTGKMRNLFTGMTWDVTNLDAPTPMHYADKGKRHYPQLTTEKLNATNRPNTFNYRRFENAFLTFLDQLDWTEILDIADSEELRRAEEDIANLSLNIERGETQAQKLTNLLLDTPSQTLKNRLLQTEAQVEKAKADRVAAEKRLADLRQKHHDLLDTSVVYSKLAGSRDLGTRVRLREEMRRKVSRIEFAFHKEIDAPLPFHKGVCHGTDETMALITFLNGARRALVFCSDGTVLVASL